MVLVLLLVAGLALLANARLSQTYSAQRAVQDYFAAQAHRDVKGMLRNATFDRGEGSYAVLFGETLLSQMMQLPDNSAIRGIRITNVRDVDSSTKSVTVAMAWDAKSMSQTYLVRKDSSQVHWLFYPTWRIEIPYTTISVKRPNQGGSISIDGVDAPPDANVSALQTIMGYHQVIMAGTAMLDSAAQTVEAIQPTTTVTFQARLSDAAMTSARDSVKGAFDNCDASKYDDCIDHTYTAPNNNYVYFLSMPGYPEIDYTNYRFTFIGNPVDGMSITVDTDAGKATVSGSCAVTMTVDGSRHYNFKGTYHGTLTWANGGFSSDIIVDCAAQKG